MSARRRKARAFKKQLPIIAAEMLAHVEDARERAVNAPSLISRRLASLAVSYGEMFFRYIFEAPCP